MRDRSPLFAAALALALLALGVSAATPPASASQPDATAPAEAGTPAPEHAEARLATPVFSLRRLAEPLSRRVADTRLAAALDRATAEGALGSAGDDTCVAVRDQAGRTLYSRMADASLIPASTLKLVTGAVVLDKLGPASRLTTEVRSAAVPAAGTVGDLWLVGGGDPQLSTADFAADGGYSGQPRLATSMEVLADRVVAAGVRQVAGRILGDDSRYDDQRLVPTWLPRYVEQFDIGPLSALTVNEGFATFPPDPSYAPSPAELAASVLAGLLQERGVTVGGTGVGTAPPGSTLVTSIDSPPMAEVVASVLQHSDNMAAEMLVKELGLRFGGEGSTAAGLAVMRDHVAALELPVEDMAAVDGSGLDRSDRLTCNLLQQLLATVGTDGELYAGLPVAGRNGTLHRRFRGTPADGRVRAKTGSLRGVSALSGWATGTDGQAMAFSLLANDLPAAAVGTALQDQVAAAVAAYPHAPRPEELAPAAPVPAPAGDPPPG